MTLSQTPLEPDRDGPVYTNLDTLLHKEDYQVHLSL